MAVQVVTPDNFQQLIETGKVPEFKPPEAAKPAEPAKAAAVATATTEAGKEPEGQKPPRDESGRFTKTDEAGKNPPAVAKTEGDEEGGDDLPEHARRVIGKKHRLQKEAEEFARDQWRERQAAETRAEKLQRELEQERAKSRPATAEAKKPKPEDFATVAEYTDALVEYRVAETLKAERAESERQVAERAKAEREREFGARLAQAKEKHADFEEVVGSIAGTDLDRVPQDVIEYIQESDFGGDLLYHLAKNPKDLDRFRKLSPRRFIAELGKLEAKWEQPAGSTSETPTTLSQAATATTPAVSKAPAPIAPLDSARSTPVHKDPSTMTFQELREFERQRKQAARR